MKAFFSECNGEADDCAGDLRISVMVKRSAATALAIGRPVATAIAAVDMSVMLLAVVMVRRSAAMLSVICRLVALMLACSTTTNNMIHS